MWFWSNPPTENDNLFAELLIPFCCFHLDKFVTRFEAFEFSSERLLL